MVEQNPTEVFSSPGAANAEKGFVVLDGPDGIAITLTPEAAIGTGESLIKAGKAARGQANSVVPHMPDDGQEIG